MICLTETEMNVWDWPLRSMNSTAFRAVIFWNSGGLNNTKYSPSLIYLAVSFLENPVSVKVMQKFFMFICEMELGSTLQQGVFMYTSGGTFQNWVRCGQILYRAGPSHVLHAAWHPNASGVLSVYYNNQKVPLEMPKPIFGGTTAQIEIHRSPPTFSWLGWR